VLRILDAGTAEDGIWCPTCRRPSILRLPLTHLGVDGVSEVGEIVVCSECAAFDVNGLTPDELALMVRQFYEIDQED